MIAPDCLLMFPLVLLQEALWQEEDIAQRSKSYSMLAPQVWEERHDELYQTLNPKPYPRCAIRWK